MTRRRRWLARAFLLAATIVFMLALGEVVCRIIPPPGSPSGEQAAWEPDYLDDPLLRYRPKPGWSDGVVKITSLGFRDADEIPVEKPRGEVRVLFLGDSYIYGAGIAWKDVVTKRLQDALVTKPGARHVRVLNTGCPGYSIDLERIVLERDGLPLSPDLAIVGFFSGNDVLDCVGRGITTVAPDHTLQVWKSRRWRDGWAPSFRDTLARRSALWARVESLPLLTRRDRERAEREAEELAKIPRKEVYLKVQQNVLEQCRKGAWEKPPLDLGWRRVAEELDRVRDICSRNGIELLVAIFPDEAHVDPEARAEAARAAQPPIDLADYEIDHTQREVARLCSARGIRCLDLLPAFREKHASGIKLYKELDSHWNEAGHALAAATLAPVVSELLSKR